MMYYLAGVIIAVFALIVMAIGTGTTIHRDNYTFLILASLLWPVTVVSFIRYIYNKRT